MGQGEDVTVEQARPQLADALTTFGFPGADPYRAVEAIVEAAEEAGLSDRDCWRLRDLLNAFIELAIRRGLDPCTLGRPEPDPKALFAPERLGGLFIEGPPADDRPPPRQEPLASGRRSVKEPPQLDLFDEPTRDDRALIDQLIAATRLYDSRQALLELFAFTIRLRAFAPFNAMILHIQRPGLTHAATARDWHGRFGRVPVRGARPLLVLRTMGPVDFVFDILDTEGRELPVDAFQFPTLGALTDQEFAEHMKTVAKENVDLVPLDVGDTQAGYIRVAARSGNAKRKHRYQLGYNKNHPAPTRFVTVAHELGHLYLGHLGEDRARRVADRHGVPKDLREVEAESVAYLVAMRNGLQPRSESYLSGYQGAFSALDVFAITRAANAVETAMGVSAQKLWNDKGKGR
ncbi:MAG: ImmA/IrrE family metallo-endopeptidase [Xanthobacteraceae bacterium]